MSVSLGSRPMSSAHSRNSELAKEVSVCTTGLRVAATSRSMYASTSATAAWCAATMRACVAASPTPQRTLADFGIENVKS